MRGEVAAVPDLHPIALIGDDPALVPDHDVVTEEDRAGRRDVDPGSPADPEVAPDNASAAAKIGDNHSDPHPVRCDAQPSCDCEAKR
jgi:hypothetical protein